jgi:hypothetical protein
MRNPFIVFGIGVIIILAILCICGYVLFFTGASSHIFPSPEASNDQGYSFAKENNIIGSIDGMLSNYQVEFIVHRGDGVDSGKNVYLSGNSLSWPDDIQFMDSNGTSLSYWIESYDADTAVIWVNIDHIPAYPGSALIKINYGKKGDASASNGYSTFILFDDFNGTTLSSIWGVPINCTASVSDGVLHLTNVTCLGRLSTVKDYDFNNTCVVARCRINTSDNSDHLMIYTESDGAGNQMQATIRGSNENDCYIYDQNGRFVAGPVPFETLESYTNVWHQISLSKSSDNYTATFLNEETGLYRELSGISPYNAEAPLTIGGHGAATMPSKVDFDWVFIRNYVPNEPTYGAWSS